MKNSWRDNVNKSKYQRKKNMFRSRKVNHYNSLKIHCNTKSANDVTVKIFNQR